MSRRRCCCCNDLYGGIIANFYRAKGSIFSVTDGTISLNPPIRGLSNYFDLINEQLWSLRADITISSTTQPFVIVNKDMTKSILSPITIASTHRASGLIALDPRNRYIFFTAVPNPNDNSAQLKRINYDGTGEVIVVSLPPPAPGFSAGFDSLHMTSSGKVIYASNDFHTAHRQLHICNADGSGDITLNDYTDGSGTGGLAVDNINNRIFWLHVIGTPNNAARLNSILFDGSGRNTDYITSNPPTPPLPSLYQANGAGPIVGTFNITLGGWSHKNQRLYFWYATTVAAMNETLQGLYSCKADGSDIKPEVLGGSIDGNWTDQNGVHIGQGNDAYQSQRILKLGCGYETTGPNTKGS